MKHIKTYESFKINENLTADGKEMIFFRINTSILN
jgi:hypothetical protein